MARKGADVLGIFPNPVTNDNATLKLEAFEKTQGTIVVSDFTGRALITQTIQLVPGLNQVSLRTFQLAKGTYHVTLYIPGQPVKTARMLKQ